MQIKKLAEGIIGSVEKKIEDSKPSESKTKSSQGQVSKGAVDLFEGNSIKQAEAKIEKERDAAWMAARDINGGCRSNRCKCGCRCSRSWSPLCCGWCWYCWRSCENCTNEVLSANKGLLQEAEAKKAALADKAMSEILSAKLTATQAATQAAVSVVTGGVAVAGAAADR